MYFSTVSIRNKAESVIFARIPKMHHSMMLHGDKVREKSCQSFNIRHFWLCAEAEIKHQEELQLISMGFEECNFRCWHVLLQSCSSCLFHFCILSSGPSF